MFSCMLPPGNRSPQYVLICLNKLVYLSDQRVWVERAHIFNGMLAVGATEQAHVS